MIPLYDSIPGRRFPVVNVALIAANLAVFCSTNYRAETRRLIRLRSFHAMLLILATWAYPGPSAG